MVDTLNNIIKTNKKYYIPFQGIGGSVFFITYWIIISYKSMWKPYNFTIFAVFFVFIQNSIDFKISPL